MSEKDEAIRYLDGIRSVLEDRHFFPYNYNALISWGIISIILTIVFPEILKNSLLYGMVFLVFMLSLGFIIEGFLIKKENINYDITDCTKKQKFIFYIYILASLFGVTLTLLLAKYQLFIPIYILWIFICGFGNFVVGYTINVQLFKKVGFLSVAFSIVLMGICIVVDDLSTLESVFARVVQLFTILFLGLVPIYIANIMKKEAKVV